MAYYPLTQEEREKARTTDLAEYLRCCGEEIKRSGSEYQWLNAGRKDTLRGNLWFDQYEQVGGDAVEFLCHFYGMEYPNAVKTLVSMGIPQVTVPVQPFPSKILELPKKAENMRRVYGYLLHQRGIDKDVLDTFVYRKLIYESAEYHNAVFIGRDPTGAIRHIHKRSTAAKGGFKGNAPGSQLEYSFHWTGADDTVFLFEAPIDMLSFITLHKPGWKNHSYAAACSVSDKVLWQMLKDQPWLKQVYLCLDSDEAGQSAVKRIAEKLEMHSIKHEILVPKHKDWNEDLLHLRKEEAQWTASRP